MLLELINFLKAARGAGDERALIPGRSAAQRAASSCCKDFAGCLQEYVGFRHLHYSMPETTPCPLNDFTKYLPFSLSEWRCLKQHGCIPFLDQIVPVNNGRNFFIPSDNCFLNRKSTL